MITRTVSAGLKRFSAPPCFVSYPAKTRALLPRAMSSSATPIAKVHTLDHVVLTVESIPATKDFYTKYLGMRHESFSSPSEAGSEAGKPRHSLHFGDQKINLHQRGAEFEPKAQNVQAGSADLCFITDTNINDILSKLKAAGVDVLEGGEVVERTGARGKLHSVYIRDPDLNLIEISNYV